MRLKNEKVPVQVVRALLSEFKSIVGSHCWSTSNFQLITYQKNSLGVSRLPQTTTEESPLFHRAQSSPNQVFLSKPRTIGLNRKRETALTMRLNGEIRSDKISIQAL